MGCPDVPPDRGTVLEQLQDQGLGGCGPLREAVGRGRRIVRVLYDSVTLAVNQLSPTDKLKVLVSRFPALWKCFVSAGQLVYFEDETPTVGDGSSLGRGFVSDGQHTYIEHETPAERPVAGTETVESSTV